MNQKGLFNYSFRHGFAVTEGVFKRINKKEKRIKKKNRNIVGEGSALPFLTPPSFAAHVLLLQSASLTAPSGREPLCLPL
jgi:hypothetical protein